MLLKNVMLSGAGAGVSQERGKWCVCFKFNSLHCCFGAAEEKNTRGFLNDLLVCHENNW